MLDLKVIKISYSGRKTNLLKEKDHHSNFFHISVRFTVDYNRKMWHHDSMYANIKRTQSFNNCIRRISFYFVLESYLFQGLLRYIECVFVFNILLSRSLVAYFWRKEYLIRLIDSFHTNRYEKLNWIPRIVHQNWIRNRKIENVVLTIVQLLYQRKKIW